MRQKRNKWLWTLVLVGIGLLATAPPAAADFRIRIQEDGAPNMGVVVTSGGLGDTSGGVLPGFMTVTAFLPNSAVDSSIGSSKPLIGNNNALDLTTMHVTTKTGGSFKIFIEDTGYTNPASGPAILGGAFGGTYLGAGTSTATFKGWANGTNAAPAYGADKFPSGPLGADPTVPAGSSANVFAPGGVVALGPGLQTFMGMGTTTFTVTGGAYSLFMEVDLVLAAGSDITFDETLTVVPVPAGLAMALSGVPCLGMGYWLRRRKVQVV